MRKQNWWNWQSSGGGEEGEGRIESDSEAMNPSDEEDGKKIIQEISLGSWETEEVWRQGRGGKMGSILDNTEFEMLMEYSGNVKQAVGN